MGEDYLLRTPEAIAISYDVAGIGTRFLAALIDALVVLGLEIVTLLGCLALFLSGGIGQQAAIILALTLSFLLVWGYFVLFETLWAGQTPGKRRLQIRVIKASGYPIGFIEAIIRNLVRVVDFLPSFYGLGLLTMFISTEARRLGDYAAGTLVVKERSDVRLQDLEPAPRSSLRMSQARRGEIDPEELEWHLEAVSAQDAGIVEEFLSRADTLDRPARERIAAELARHLAERIGAREPLEPLRFLQRITQLRSQDEV